MSRGTCFGCEWWELLSPKQITGLCRRNPPVAVWNAKDDIEFALHPPTMADDWCGEFKHKEINDADESEVRAG